MKSIRSRLTLAVLTATLVLVSAAGACLYLYLRDELLEQFDHSLQAEATSLTSLVREDSDGSLDFGLDEDVPPNPRGRHWPYFLISRLDGTVLMRSSSLKGHDLPHVDVGDRGWKFSNLSLPDGNPGRAATIRFTPLPEDADNSAPPRTASPAPRHPEVLQLTLARGRGEIDSTLAVLLSSLLVAAGALGLTSAVVVTFTIRQALRPLTRIGDEVERIGPASLGARFSTDELPTELVPICQRLNELLGRLGEAFARERRFTADAAHELRTPIAELRTLAEVALRWPADKSAAPQTFEDVLAVSQQMERLVDALLANARCESSSTTLVIENVDLAPLIADAWRPFAPGAHAKHLRINWEVPPALPIRSDSAMLRRLLGNLFSNAVAYCPPGGEITCRAQPLTDDTVVNITNTSAELTPADLPHLSEPFWRKDPARSGGAHAGLGLTLVAGYARALNAQVEFTLPAPDLFDACVILAPQL
ncbi:MAG TPA: ATP-binding protein [Tepidisphaeraceae bacterium]|jgi:two-component system sensor histidine kinase QseC|nr:ATP-binding protein [Tepidisphaeraceae bacterium]